MTFITGYLSYSLPGQTTKSISAFPLAEYSINACYIMVELIIPILANTFRIPILLLNCDLNDYMHQKGKHTNDVK